MKIRFALAVVFMAVSTLLSAQPNEAVRYMEKVGNSVGHLKNETWGYLRAATQGRSARTQERRRQALIRELDDVYKEIEAIGPFNGDDTYQKEVLNYLSLTSIVMKEDFAQIMDLEAIAEQSYDDMEAYMMANEIANAKMDSAFQIYKAGHEAFARQNNINLIEGEGDSRDQAIAKASAALSYYNEIFLIFFRANVQENYALEALNRDDIISLEQNTQALVAAADKGLAALDTMPRFNRDPKLINAARRLLEFYKKEGEETFPAMVDFYVKKDRFDRLNESIQAKDRSDLTQEEIDEYNAALEDFNDMVPVFNELNEESNEERIERYEDWEERVEEFFENHAE